MQNPRTAFEFDVRRSGLGLLFALLVAATLWAWHAARRHVAADLSLDFSRRVEAAKIATQRQYDILIQTIHASRGLFQASEHVDPYQWRAFTTGLQVERSHPAVVGLAFVANVQARAAAAFQAQMRNDGETDFRVQSANMTEQGRMVVQYVDPSRSMTLVPGDDVVDDPVRRIALERARDGDMLVMTPAIPLGENSNGGVGVMACLPVYRFPNPIASVEERRQALLGWMVAMVDTQHYFRSVIETVQPGLRLQVFDGSPVIARELFSGHSGEDGADPNAAAILFRIEMMQLGGRSWTMQFSAMPSAVEAHHRFLPWATLGGGLFIDLLITVAAWSLTRTQAQAQRIARGMTASLRISHQQAEKLALVAARTEHGVIITDAEGRIEWVNIALRRMAGLTNESIKGNALCDFIASKDDRQAALLDLRQNFSDGTGNRFELSLKRQDGQSYWAAVELQPIRNSEDALSNFIVIMRDVTQQKMVKEELLRDSLHDKLTGLPNRALLMDRLAACIAKTQRDPGLRFAVLFIDLDRFKVINDSLGHAAGDALLVNVASKLRQSLRSSDGITVARLGGDEFTVLLDGISDAADAIRVADRLQKELSAPVTIAGHEVVSTVSIGIALSDRNYRSPEDVLRDADIAMYRAKAQGKARHEVFDQDMHRRIKDRLALENDLRRALAHNEFVPYYQPIIDLSSRRLIGFESLVRWQHPQRGVVSPMEFIPIAEETGLIVPLGRWILAESCRQVVRWQRKHRDHQHLSISVNLSVKQLADESLVEQVSRIIRETDVDPACLKLEITESAVMEDLAKLRSRLAELKALRVQLILDDFGTGYSSLSCLHQFPIDGLKIDRAFIQSMGLRRDYAAVVQAIVTLAHNLGIQVVAEGVENVDQLVQLQVLECDQAQGYHFGKPMPASEADAFIAQMSVAESLAA